MSNQEFIITLRAAMREEIISRRRALRQFTREYAGDHYLLAQAERHFEEGLFTIREHHHTIEQRTGFPILSTTRAQMRREGRRV